MPCSCALRAAFSAASWAAKGVDLREPLKPTWPEDAHARTPPDGSVIETMVLLNVLLMWAWPSGTFFLPLRRPVFLGPAARDVGGITSAVRRRSSSDPYGCGRWSWCADHGRAGHDGDAVPGNYRSRSSGGCRPGSRGGGHPPPCSC